MGVKKKKIFQIITIVRFYLKGQTLYRPITRELSWIKKKKKKSECFTSNYLMFLFPIIGIHSFIIWRGFFFFKKKMLFFGLIFLFIQRQKYLAEKHICEICICPILCVMWNYTRSAISDLRLTTIPCIYAFKKKKNCRKNCQENQFSHNFPSINGKLVCARTTWLMSLCYFPSHIVPFKK